MIILDLLVFLFLAAECLLCLAFCLLLCMPIFFAALLLWKCD